MIITKFAHSCFTVEKDGQHMVVDPGAWSDDFVTPSNVVAVVVTHEHPDHCDPEKLAIICSQNPDAVIYAHSAVVAQLADLPTQAVTAGEIVQAGAFQLEFFGGQHATIHSSYPIVANLGVMIDDRLYHPGDSYTLPGKPVDILALPITAPWSKISDAMDFLTEIKPRHAFPEHDAILSATGQALYDRMLAAVATAINCDYQRFTTLDVSQHPSL